MKINNIVPNDTIFIVSSKSFKTLETLTLLKEALKWSGDISKFVAITANKDEAQKHNINCIIEFDQEIEEDTQFGQKFLLSFTGSTKKILMILWQEADKLILTYRAMKLI